MIIETKNITKRYKANKTALDNITLKITPGITGLIGRNGAGKSTLMRILATVIEPNEGEILVDDTPLYKDKTNFRKKLGYLPQNTTLMPRLNIVEFLEYVCILKDIKDKTERKTLIGKTIETVGLENEKKKLLAHYSGGMLRRAGIAQALIGNPKLLIIDEPTTGLDPEEKLYFLNILSSLSDNISIIYSTHIISEIEQICNRICILDEGTVKYAGNKKELLKKISNNTFVHKGVNNIDYIKATGTVIALTYYDGMPLVKYVSAQPLSHESVNISPGLEDAYIYSIGGIKDR